MLPAVRQVVVLKKPSPRTILGPLLVGWWTAERLDLITHGAGLVSSWRDVIGGYDLAQATGAAQPAYSPTGMGAFPAITSDGVDDFLRLAAIPSSFPIGALYSEIIVVGSQLRAGASAGIENIFGYGGASTSARIARRTTGTSINRANCIATSVSSSNTSVDFSGRHVSRCIFSPTAVQQDVDWIAGPSAAVTPATASGFATFGGGNAASPTGFSNFAANQILVLTGPPSAAQLAALAALFAPRIA